AKAVYNFDLDIKENEFVVIVGPSGCGKSTTLRMIAGLETISSGRLFIGGEYSNYKSSKDRKMAMVFQSYALYPQMSVFDNIAFPLKINKYKLPKTDKSMLVATQTIERLSAEKLEETKKTVQAAKTESGDATAYISSRLSVKNAVAGKLKKLDLNSAEEVVAAIAAAETEREKLRGKYREKGLDIC
ncbi:ATP-binding cassette domain-containing protein, partial [uncultured Dubosiella sp.]|uniref:ATP-binding cassette domain-containing protein n=1 Tax=uncultured Dubosiella sp. TaxID=1937011 RepID=UPI0025B579AD